MTAMVSVVSGGTVVHAQQLAAAKEGKAVRISAVKGARYVLAEMHGGSAAGDISAKRIGKNLVLEQAVDGGEPASVIIEDFYGSEGQLVGLGADGEYLEYLAASEHGATEAAAMSDGASSLLSLAAGQSVLTQNGFQFAEGSSSVFSSALAGAAAVAGGFALSNSNGSGSKAQAAPVASGFMLGDLAADVPTSVVADDGIVANVEAGLVALEANDVPESSVVEENNLDAGLAPEAGDSRNRVRPSATSTDGAVKAAGLVAAASVDTAPVIDALLDKYGVIQGVIANGGYTDDGYPTIMGRAEPGVKVHVYRGKFLLGYAFADANGEWSYTPKTPFTTGTYSITIIHQYPSGESSELSAPYVFTVDKIPPPIPVITGIVDDEGRITGAITDQSITDDSRPTINGTAEAHATLIIYDKGKEIGRTTAGADGNWSFTPGTALADGVHMLSYSAMDRAGNSSQQTGVIEFTVDTRPEKINIYYAEDDVGSVTGEIFSGAATDDSTPTLFGTATAGGIVKIYEGSVLLGQVTADVDGTWQFTPTMPLSEGAHAFHATVTLVAKGESAPSKLFKLEVDLTPPGEPTLDAVMDDVGAVQGMIANGGSTDDATPTLSGKSEVGSTVHIYDNGKLLGSAVADAKGEWIYTPSVALAEGEHTFTIAATDAAGNKAASAAQYKIYIDFVPPAAPTIDSVYDDVGAVQGELQNGASTDDTQPTFKGKAEANSTVIIRDRGTEIGRAAVNENGDWSFTPATSLNTGIHSITVVAMDKAGNISAPSNTFDFSLVATPGMAPSITSIYDDFGAQQGELYSGSSTDDTTPLIKGKATPNSIVVLMDNGVEIGRPQVDSSGNWSFAPPQALAYGLHNVVATEVGGGASSAVFGFRITEPNRGSGFEDFSTLVPAAQGENWPKHVFPSGLVVSGVYGGSGISGGTIDQSLRPEDAGNAMYLTGSGVAYFTLPSASSEVTFALNSYASTSYTAYRVYFTDKSGASIGVVYSGVGVSSFQRIHFEAPAGKEIAGFTVYANHSTAQNAYIDSVQWGPHRLPSDISISSAETDDAGARIVYGKVENMPYLVPGMAIQVSTDGGLTWANASFSEGSWALIQKDMPPGDWTAQVRIVELSSGLSVGLTDSKQVHTKVNGAPTISRIADAEGMYTAEKAAHGSVVEVSLVGTGAKVGDKVHIKWGTVTYDHVLTQANIDSGNVAIKVPAAQVLMQGVNADFLVTAQIIAANGLIGIVSQPQKVIGTYTVSAAKTDALATQPEDNAYSVAGFKVSTGGVMEVTGLTSATHAGLTLTDSARANATFVMDKPVREIALRFSGIDSEKGVIIQFFDVKGNLIEEQTIHGNATAFHANAYSYSPQDARVDIGSFKIIANEPSVTLDRFTWKEVSHNADARDPAVVDSNMESFYGTDGDDVVTLTVKMDDYFIGASAGIHGGAGIDTLRIAGPSGTMVKGASISSMEIIELVGQVAQTVKFDVSDVLRNGQVDAFYTGDSSRVQMMVKAGSLGSVYLSDQLVGGASVQNSTGGTPGDMGDWSKGATVAIDGVSYVSYKHSNLAVEVLVQVGAKVTLENRAEYKQYGTRSLFSEGL